MSPGAPPELTAALLRAKVVDLQRLVHLAVNDHLAVGPVLGLPSSRLAVRLLQLWRNQLFSGERGLLMQLDLGTEPIQENFPVVIINPTFKKKARSRRLLHSTSITQKEEPLQGFCVSF